MEKIKGILKELAISFSVSGHEFYGSDTIGKLASGIFDEVKRDSVGNYILIKRSGKKDAKKLLIDAHFDTVGMMVTDIKDGGFLSFITIGGLDTNVLPSTEVIIRGKEDVYGIITSIPPHLKTTSKAPKIKELLIDTGYSKDKIKELVSVGDPIVYKNQIDFIHNDQVISAGLDDKACLCAAIDAVSKMDKATMAYDVYLIASMQEEVGKAGPARAAFDIDPDIAIIVDVNFAKMDKDDNFECIEIGKGASVDISAQTDRRLTRNIRRALDENGIEYQIVCEPKYTGTNNEPVAISGLGVRTAVLSVPLKSMHTASETASLHDIKSLSDILVCLATREEL